jgi:hypothetical protein
MPKYASVRAVATTAPRSHVNGRNAPGARASPGEARAGPERTTHRYVPESTEKESISSSTNQSTFVHRLPK